MAEIERQLHLYHSKLAEESKGTKPAETAPPRGGGGGGELAVPQQADDPTVSMSVFSRDPAHPPAGATGRSAFDPSDARAIVLVDRVDADSPAAEAGLLAGDRVLKFGHLQALNYSGSLQQIGQIVRECINVSCHFVPNTARNSHFSARFFIFYQK